MAGRGPAPKDPAKRVRRNAGGQEMRVIQVEPDEQPKLPTFYLVDPITGTRSLFRWPKQTVEWWQMWADSPLSAEFTSTDWSELRDTALLHAAYWKGDLKQASEMRLRVAKFGATPEDRARLKIVFALADEAEAKQNSGHHGGSRGRRGPFVKPAVEAPESEPG